METNHEYGTDFGACVACDGDDRDPHRAGESRRLDDAGLLLRILCVGAFAILLAISIILIIKTYFPEV